MRAVLLIILTIILGLLLGPLIQQIPGSLVLVFTESTVQMRLWQAVVMLAAGGLLFVSGKQPAGYVTGQVTGVTDAPAVKRCKDSLL